jgi:hypothetical protein
MKIELSEKSTTVFMNADSPPPLRRAIALSVENQLSLRVPLR